MNAFVTFDLPDGTSHTLGPGDLVGRSLSAALILEDPRISEAHAFVSLRRGDLFLLSLRRLLGVAGKPVSEVLLRPGTRVELAEGLFIVVRDTAAPKKIPALEIPGVLTRPLAPVSSLFGGPPPRVVSRFVPDAAAYVWSQGPTSWKLRIANDTPRSIQVGDTFTIGGFRFSLGLIDAAAMAGLPTTPGTREAPLHIVANYESVEIHRSEHQAVVIGGINARLVSELVAFGGPVSWEVLARELWRDEADLGELRHRWDVALGRLRSRLRGAGIRGDLLHSDGSGQIQLILYSKDVVVDRT